MAEHSKIEWTNHTFNPWIGCQAASPDGCKNCYAADWAKRYGRDFAARTRTSEANWKQPLKWDAQAQREGRRFRVFCASLADVFDNQVPPEWRVDLFALIQATPHLDWLLLTKRIGNAKDMIFEARRALLAPFELYDPAPLHNVWIGATVVNQAEADRDIPKLLAVPARVRFLSIEPMLGPIDLAWIDDGAAHREVPRECWGSADDDDSPPGLWWNALTGERTIMHGGSDVEFYRRDARVDWVICGGESGPHARPMNPDWACSLRDQCASAGVPFLFKQWGEWAPTTLVGLHSKSGAPTHDFATDRRVEIGNGRSLPFAIEMRKVGKKVAGRLLDGRVHDGFPG